MELKNVLFINFVCYFTEFKVREYKFVFTNNCLSTLTANTKRNNICYHTSADCHSWKVSKSCFYNSLEQPFRGALIKRCSENMQQIYRRTPMPKCNFNKVAMQLLIKLRRLRN